MDEQVQKANYTQKEFEGLCDEINAFAENLRSLLKSEFGDVTRSINVSPLQIVIVVIREKLSVWRSLVSHLCRRYNSKTIPDIASRWRKAVEPFISLYA